MPFGPGALPRAMAALPCEKRRETLIYMLHRHHPNRHMSVGGARNTVETVGELDGHYDGAIGAARAETSPNIEVR